MCTKDAITSDPTRPVIIIIPESDQVNPEKLLGHYRVNDLRRWKRLNDCVFWGYLDLIYVYTKWDRTWEAVRVNFESKERVCGFDLSNERTS
jgi:hypothetical protein